MTKGERIKKRREELGIGQAELAEKVGTTKQAIYKYETGIVTNIPSDKIELMASALSVSPAYIMGWNIENKKMNQLTEDEMNIIAHYRAKPELQSAVKILLGIDQE